MMWIAVGTAIAVVLAAGIFGYAARLAGRLNAAQARLDELQERIARSDEPLFEIGGASKLPHVVRSPHNAIYMRDSDESKPSLLYICPVVPATTGSGMAMRAAAVLRVLTRHYRVWLLATPFSARISPPLARLADLCEEWAIIPLDTLEREVMTQPWRTLSQPPGHGTPVFWNMRFDVVHVFRLYSWPVARFYAGLGARRHLDLDDIESRTHTRHAELWRDLDEPESAALEEELAERFRILEDEIFAQVDRIYVCSEVDRAEIARRTDTTVHLLPNTVTLPQAAAHEDDDGPFTFFFVGSLEYFPNQDAVVFFADNVLPLIRERASREIVFTVAGSGAESLENEITNTPGVELAGQVNDLTPCYERADAVVVPLASGGGTRVKILEAFSYRLPVVSTTLGVEGINAQNEQEILIADTPEAFAEACLRLMDDMALTQRLTENAYKLLRERYTLDAIDITPEAPVHT